MNEKLAWFMKELTTLCAAAEASGVLLRVDNVSVPPLAMGNHRHRVSVREARFMAASAQPQQAVSSAPVAEPYCPRCRKGFDVCICNEAGAH